MSNQELAEQPIFIVGPSRSGTTLLRAMLCHHSDVHITAETHWFDDLRLDLDLQKNLDEESRRRCEDWFLALSHRPFGHQGDPEQGWMTRADMVAKVAARGGSADDYFSSFCQLDAERQGKSRWGEKTPRHAFRIDEILAAYPQAKVICMARDPRGVVASYRDWKSQGGHDFDRDPGHSKALEDEHKRTRSSYHILIATFMWSSAVNASLAAVRKHGKERVMLLRYEDLVLNAEQTNREVCAWLGMQPEPKMLDVPMVNSSFQQYDSAGGINRNPVEGWKNRLSKAEIGVIQAACSKVMRASGYEKVDAGLWQPFALAKWISFPFAVLNAARANRNRFTSLPTYVWQRVRNLVRR